MIYELYTHGSQTQVICFMIKRIYHLMYIFVYFIYFSIPLLSQTTCVLDRSSRRKRMCMPLFSCPIQRCPSGQTFQLSSFTGCPICQCVPHAKQGNPANTESVYKHFKNVWANVTKHVRKCFIHVILYGSTHII